MSGALRPCTRSDSASDGPGAGECGPKGTANSRLERSARLSQETSARAVLWRAECQASPARLAAVTASPGLRRGEQSKGTKKCGRGKREGNQKRRGREGRARPPSGPAVRRERRCLFSCQTPPEIRAAINVAPMVGKAPVEGRGDSRKWRRGNKRAREEGGRER